MNKRYARKLAETITGEQIMQMLNRAKAEITDWNQPATVNPIMSKGAAWNILGRKFTLDKKYDVIGIRNILWEFGDYLPDNLKEKAKPKVKRTVEFFHEEPIFD